ncbi:MAG: SGNH/GDSL hydrolase family protein, partial [Myxococcota bacterium]
MSNPKASSELAGNLLTALVSFGILALLFGLLEGALRVGGIGARDASASRLAYQQLPLPLLRQAERPDGTPVWVTADPRLPFQTILAAKPANGLRIVTLGGSATAGLGFSPNVTFARHLERMLEEALPERRVEVLNLGIVALSSRQVKRVVAEVCEGYAPDLVVVYSGNNEFLELHAEKYAAANRGVLASLADAVERYHVFRAIRLALYGPPTSPSLADRDVSHEDLRLTQARIIEDVELTAEEVGQVVDGYEANLENIVEVASAAGTRLVLVSVASNWKWRGRSDLPADWMGEFVPLGDAKAAPDLARLLEVLDERVAAAPADERSALLFRRAVVEEALGDFEAARVSYAAAMNEDPHLRRALDAMNERVEAVARRRKVTFLDAVATLADDAEHGIVGFGHFYDYVHFTPRGAVVLAEALFRTLVSMGVVPAERLDVADAYRERRLRALA